MGKRGIDLMAAERIRQQTLMFGVSTAVDCARNILEWTDDVWGGNHVDARQAARLLLKCAASNLAQIQGLEEKPVGLRKET